jgi:diacylglycerol kinase (ATP)
VSNLAVISNVLSHRNRSSIDAVDRLTAAAVVPHIKLRGIDGLGAALDGLARAGIRDLAVNGGDGTVQAVLTDLLGRRPFATLPRIIVLRGGRTNLTAIDLGPRGSNAVVLERLFGLSRHDDLDRFAIQQPVLRVRDETNRIDAYGVFFGDAAIVETIALCQRRAHAIGLSGGPARAWTLLNAIAERAFGSEQNSLFRGHEAAVTIDGAPVPPTRWTVQLATTLDRLVLGSRPYWRCGEAPIRWTGIGHPAPGLAWAAPKILFGGEQRRLPADIFFSHGGEVVTIRSAEPFTIDGEMFTTTTERTMTLTAADRVAFLKF